MELTELNNTDVQELFHVTWHGAPTRGLCRWNNQTYLFVAPNSDHPSVKPFMFTVDMKDVIEIEMYYKHLTGVVGGVQLNVFDPTLRLINLYYGRSISEKQKWDRAITWWTKNSAHMKGWIDNYSRNKEPIAIWRRDGSI